MGSIFFNDQPAAQMLLPPEGGKNGTQMQTLTSMEIVD